MRRVARKLAAILVIGAAAAPGAAASSAPTITLSGSLYDNRGTTLTQGVYDLHIRAEGRVELVQVMFFGEYEEEYWEQECRTANCPLEGTFRFDTYEWEPEEQVITVVATDAAGRKTTSEELRVTHDGPAGDPGYEAEEGTVEDWGDVDDSDVLVPPCDMGPEPSGSASARTEPSDSEPSDTGDVPNTLPVSIACVVTTPGVVDIGAPDEGESDDGATDEPVAEEDADYGEESGDDTAFEDPVDEDTYAKDDSDGGTPPSAVADEDTEGAAGTYGEDDVAPIASMR